MNDRLEIMDKRTERQMIRDTFARLPDPEQFAYQLPSEVADMLTGARTVTGGWTVSDAVAEVLRPYGLCEYGGRCLTVFGGQVRKAVMDDHSPIQIKGRSR